jgi:hypothetical protein
MTDNANNQNIQAQRLSQVLLATPSEQDCQACLDALEAYIDAQLAGQPYTTRYTQVAQHLDACIACAESYGLIYETRLNEATQPEPAAIPKPDLSFLTPASTAIDQLNSLITSATEWLGNQLRFSFSQALLDLLPPPMPSTLAVRGSQAMPLQDITLELAGGSISQVHVVVLQRAEATDQCDLHIQLTIPGREWPDLVGIPITLNYGVQHASALSDAWGEAVFRGVPIRELAEMQIGVGL